MENHYGYGLRNDEQPYADKIEPGKCWNSLSAEDQQRYWNGSIPVSGGSTNGLRRRAWDEPAGTITTTPLQKLSCQLHPGATLTEGGKAYNVTPKLPPNGLTVVELFAGGGLMAVGLKAAGYNLIWANDFEKAACTAYAHNIGEHIIHADITQIDPRFIPKSDVIAGGPPCQDFSVAGMGAGEEGERGKLVWTYLSIIQAKQPKAFIFENVKGLIQAKHRHTFDALLAQFKEIGYTVTWKLINAWDYGVAQKRERVFIVGIRSDLGFAFEFPPPSEADYRTQVLRDVIGDLPEPMDAVGKNVKKAEHQVDMGEPSPTITAQYRCQTVNVDDKQYYYSQPFNYEKRAVFGDDEPAPTIKEHNSRPMPPNYKPHPRDAHIVANHNPEKQLPQGYQNVIDGKTRTNFGVGIPINDGSQPAKTLLARYWEKGPPSEVYQPPMNHEGKEISDKAMEGYERRQAPGAFGFRVNPWDEPSPTIMGRIFNEGKAFVHPNLESPRRPRRFTVRECLRIQSAPDSYVLPDTLSLSAQYKIVGNGVASRVGYLLGMAISEQLEAFQMGHNSGKCM